MIPSGITPLDEALGGVVPSRIHLLIGGLGSGKTAACLQFIAAALRNGEHAVLITADRGSDLKALAVHLGIDIETPLRSGLLQMIRFREEFHTAMASSRSPERALTDLGSMIGDLAPARIAIDPLDPFLGDGGPVNAGSFALVSFLERLGATSLLTHSAEPSAAADRRLDPIIARSVATLRLERGRGETHNLRVLRSRLSAAPEEPIAFEIRRDAGFRAITDGGANSERSSEVRVPRNLVVFHTGDDPSQEIIDLLDRDYETVVRPAPAADAALELASDAFDGIVISITHNTVPAALSLIERLNAQPDIPPIILAARFNLRSIDRARALRAGADEILATDMSSPELLQRLAAALRRPHRFAGDTSGYSETVILQARGGFTNRPLNRDEFASALAAHVAHDNPIQYTVVTFAPSQARDAHIVFVPLRHIADVVMRASRVRDGDLTAVVDDCVAIYLHGAQQEQAAAFADRVRKVWSARRQPPLTIETYPYPSGEPGLRTMFELSAS